MNREERFNLSKIARRIARESLRVRDKELIWIECGVHNIAFAEDIAAEVALIGGYPVIEVISPHVEKEILLNAPPEYLARPRRNIARMKEMVDGFIQINPQQDPCYMADVPIEKLHMAKISRKAERKVYEEMQLKRVLVEYPTIQQAKFYGIDYVELFEMVWGGIEVDPEYLYRITTKMDQVFTRRPEIHIKSQKGTDLKLKYDNRKILHDTGTIQDESYLTGEPLVNLPAGEIYLAPLENSANGIAVFDEVFLQGNKISDLALKFEEGRVIDFSAREGEEIFGKYFNSLTLPGKIIAEFGIGLNPFIKKVTGLASLDEKAVQTVHIAIGSNSVFGGRNFAENHDDFVIQKPTVKSGDYVFIRDGKFAPELDITTYPGVTK